MNSSWNNFFFKKVWASHRWLALQLHGGLRSSSLHPFPSLLHAEWRKPTQAQFWASNFNPCLAFPTWPYINKFGTEQTISQLAQPMATFVFSFGLLTPKAPGHSAPWEDFIRLLNISHHAHHPRQNSFIILQCVAFGKGTQYRYLAFCFVNFSNSYMLTTFFFLVEKIK